jgi:type I restriction enzyme, R subunit
MSDIGKPERATQNRVIALFRDELGYRYLGDWADRDGNSNIEQEQLTTWLTRNGYTPSQISVAIYKLSTEADNHSRNLYGNNQAVYNLLRYGVPVKIEAGKVTETVRLINWQEPGKNDFAIAREVTLHGSHERRPDIVLYVNGIAIGVVELKNSRISIGEGIRQNLSNQQPEFNAWFFSTVQFIFAGNDSEGLQFGTILTPEKYFLKWKEDEQNDTRFKLDKYLLKMCRKDRLIELMHDFVLFDGGIKKLPRAHQYFGIKAAQQHVRDHKGGIIWHTQGSGKSIVMVLLAKWILENNPNARVAIITDRDELDKQIERVFGEVGEPIKRTNSGRDLMGQLGQAKPRLLCSLVHKFGRKDVDDFEAFIRELGSLPSKTVGEVFVFVDECHRTQSGRLHRVMKAMMPNAVFIGFTGTPLLAKDRQTSLEVFGGYIHTYKFSEGVEDKVVLDLLYEARDIDQRLGSEDKIDAWFEAKTKGLNDWQKDELKKQWGTMQKVLSSRSRMDRVVNDIVFDFSVQPRLSSDRGNAILVASSIYEASKYFDLFQKTPLKGKCAVVTSYNPQARDITLEETGSNTVTEKQFIYDTYTELLKAVEAKPGMTKTETYEENAKSLFTKEPANMKLLVVVDKLLTGFDAPPCTYLYIDKSTARRLLGQIGVQSDAFGSRIAAPPSGLHLLNEDAFHFHAQYRLPLRDEDEHSSPDLFSIPLGNDGLLRFVIRPRTNSQHHLIASQLNVRGVICLDQLQKVAFVPNIMAFAVEVLARRFAFLLAELVLLLLDPAQFGNGEDADGVQAHARRGRNPHSASRWIYAEMDIPNVLQNHIHRDVAQLKPRDHQYSCCALTIKKMRSTSATSCNTSYSARLMTCSRAWTPRQPSGRVFLTVSSILTASSSFWLRLLYRARFPGVFRDFDVSSACPASTFFARSAMRFKYASYSMALAFLAAMISSRSSDIFSK